MCRGKKFCSEFFTQYLSIYVHISGSIRPITLIWASLERSFPPAEIEYRWYQFWSNLMTSEVEERLIMAGNSRHGRHWVNQICHFPKQSSATEQYFYLKLKSDHRSKFSNSSNWTEEAWKKSGLQRDLNLWVQIWIISYKLHSISISLFCKKS